MSQLLFVFATYLLIGAAIATLVFLVLGDNASRRRLDNDIFRELDCIRRQFDALQREISDRKRP